MGYQPTITRNKQTTEEKIRIVLESLNTNISIAELCRKHNLQPPTFYQWRKKFLERGKAAVADVNGNASGQLQKENESLKQIIADLTIANDAFKKRWKRAKDECHTDDVLRGHQPQNVPILWRLTQEQKQYNRSHSRVRIVVEHTISRIKKFGIMHDIFRNRLCRYDRISDIVCGIVNFKMGWSSQIMIP